MIEKKIKINFWFWIPLFSGFGYLMTGDNLSSTIMFACAIIVAHLEDSKNA